MSGFAEELAGRVEGYIALRRSLGYAFHKQAAILWALTRYVEARQIAGPVTQDLALRFLLSWEGTANGRAIRHGYLPSTTPGPRHSILERFPDPAPFRRLAS